MLSAELTCPACSWRTICGEAEIVRRLRQLGLFRRATEPPEEIVREMLRTHGHRLPCDHCGATGLAIRLGADDSDAAEWEQVILCEICRQPIPPQRLEIVPTATRCTACQDAADRGASQVEPEYCPRCGAILELRVSRAGGLTRYKQWCTGNPPCRL
jgi:hypothetical protein